MKVLPGQILLHIQAQYIKQITKEIKDISLKTKKKIRILKSGTCMRYNPKNGV